MMIFIKRLNVIYIFKFNAFLFNVLFPYFLLINLYDSNDFTELLNIFFISIL
jgi:hypothetical protein